MKKYHKQRHRLLSLLLCLLMTVSLLGTAMPAYAQEAEQPPIAVEETINEVTEDTTLSEALPETEPSGEPEDVPAPVSAAAEEMDPESAQNTPLSETLPETEPSGGSEDVPAPTPPAAEATPSLRVTANVRAAAAPETTLQNTPGTATHTIIWADGTDSVINGNHIDVTASVNKTMKVIAQVRFSCGGDDIAGPGEIEIRVPAHILFKRDGAPADTVSVPLNEEGNPGGNTNFWYRIDDNATPDNLVDDEIVISNYGDVTGSYYLLCSIAYSFTPSEVANGYTNDSITARFSIPDEMGQPVEIDSTDTLSITNHTDAKLSPKQSKEFKQKYETWQPKWGTAPVDAGDYYYVEWVFELTAEGVATTQPYTVILKDSPAGGSVVYADKRAAVINSDGTMDYEVKDVSVPDSDPGNISYPTTVVTKHPRSGINAEGETIVQNDALLELHGYDDAYDSINLSASYTYEPVNLFSFEKYSVDSDHADALDITGGYHTLLEGVSITAPYSLYATLDNFDPSSGVSTQDKRITVMDGDASNPIYFGTKNGMNPEPLERGDYSFVSAYLGNIKAFDYAVDPERGVIKSDLPLSEYDPLAFYVQKNNSTQWELWATLIRSTSDTAGWDIAYANGTQKNRVRTLDFSDEVKAVKVEALFTRGVLNLNLDLDLKIYPTDHVKNYLSTTSGGNFIWNTAAGAVQDAATSNELTAITDTAAVCLTKKVASPTNSKTMGTVVNEIDKQRVAVPCTVKFSDSGKGAYSSNTHLNPYSSGIIYDLLPKGTSVENLKVKIYKGAITWPDLSFSWDVEYVQNWRGSGRTMMIVRISGEEQARQGQFASGVVMSYDLISTWENIIDNGTKLDNYAAYFSTCGDIANGRADNGNGYRDPATNVWGYFYDLDEDGNTDSNKKNVRYASASTTIVVPTSAESGFKKFVKVPGTSYATGHAVVNSQEDYAYQLRYQSMSAGSVSSNLVFYDVLESAQGNNPYWKGILTGVDTSAATQQGASVVVYYSTTPGLNLYENNALTAQADLSNSTYWSTVPPDDLSTVTALAFDLSKQANGDPFTVKNGRSVYVEIYMNAASKESVTLDDPSNTAMNAYNQAVCQSTTTGTDASSFAAAEQSNIVSVAIRETTAVSVQKVWSDGAENHTHDAVTIHLYADGVDTGKTMVLNDSNGWTGIFSDLDYKTDQNSVINYTILEDSVPGYTTEYNLVKPNPNADIMFPPRYTVINTAIESPAESDGDLTVTTTVSGSGSDQNKEFTFTVTLDKNDLSGTYGDMTFTDGVATFTLKHGESKTATDLPAGVSYAVEESDNDGYTVTKTGETGTIQTGVTATAAFVNHKDSGGDNPESPVDSDGNLTVTNTVSGSGSDQSKAFTFTVTLNDTTITGEYGDMAFSNGIATFTLKHGESKTASGLPAGVFYAVEESDNSGYTVTKTNETGTIQGGTTAIAAFENYKGSSGGGGGGVKITKTVTGNKAPAQSIGYEFKVWVKSSGGSAVSENVSYKLVKADGTTENGSLTIGKDGYSFSLKNGESMTFSQIDSDRTVEVKEITTGSFTTTAKGLTDGICEISSDTTKTVAFVNDYGNTSSGGDDPDDPTPTDPKPTEPTKPDPKPTEPNPSKPTERPLDKVPQTGDNSNTTLWIALMLMSVFGLAGLTFGNKYLNTRRSR